MKNSYKFLHLLLTILLCVLFGFVTYFALEDKIVKADNFDMNTNYSQQNYDSLASFYNSSLVSNMSCNVIVKGFKQTYSMPYLDNNYVSIATVELRFNNNSTYRDNAYNSINNKYIYNTNIMYYPSTIYEDWGVGFTAIKGDLLFVANKISNNALRVSLCLDLYSIVEYRSENNCSYYDVDNEHMGFKLNNCIFYNVYQGSATDKVYCRINFPCISSYFSNSYLNSVCQNISAYYYDSGFDFIKFEINHNIFNNYLFNYGYCWSYYDSTISTADSLLTSFYNNGALNYNFTKNYQDNIVLYYWQSSSPCSYDFFQFNFVGGWHSYNGALPEYLISFSNKLGSGSFLQNDFNSDNDYSNNLYKKDVQWYDIFGHLYNFLIYLIFDMPLISNITQPIYALISGTTTTFNWLGGIVASLGIFGAFAMCYLLFAIIKRFL